MRDLAGARVLVTGAGGFIGRRVMALLELAGADAVALVRRETSGVRFAEVVADLADPDSVAVAVAGARPEIVIHLAAARGGDTPSERENLMRVNVLGTQALLEAAAEAGVEAFVHAGSSLEYERGTRPLRENDPIAPRTAYAASKAASTLLVQQFARQSGLSAVVLRIFSVYGPGEPAHRLVPTALRASLEATPLPMTAGRIARDFVYVDDVADALLTAARSESLEPGEALNVGTGVETSNEELVETVARVTGRPIETLPGAYAPRATDSEHWCADVTAVTARIGWRATTSVEDGIRAMAIDAGMPA